MSAAAVLLCVAKKAGVGCVCFCRQSMLSSCTAYGQQAVLCLARSRSVCSVVPTSSTSTARLCLSRPVFRRFEISNKAAHQPNQHARSSFASETACILHSSRRRKMNEGEQQTLHAGGLKCSTETTVRAMLYLPRSRQHPRAPCHCAIRPPLPPSSLSKINAGRPSKVDMASL